MVSYETAQYFNGEEFEQHRYSSALGTFHRAEFQYHFALSFTKAWQSTAFNLGLLIMYSIVAHQISARQRPVGHFVTLATFLAQLQRPLESFARFYGSIQLTLMNAERMLSVFRQKPAVIDEAQAVPLEACIGEISFQNAVFCYTKSRCQTPCEPALNAVTFHRKPGTNTPLVRESGGGKSTVFRLLFRYGNLLEGILLHGCDVRDICIDSLRGHIGAVPQDPVLFNDTLMNNLRYARPDATDDDIYDACRAASMHKKIIAFPDGYHTKVGERGLRLSGGERQRVAIARAILKESQIILLNEASAQLDTENEYNIQRPLAPFSSTGPCS